jgi:hypothetical protein
MRSRSSACIASKAVISEGIADSARKIVFTNEDLARFLHNALYPLCGLEGIDVDRQLELSEAMRELDWVGDNAALLLHVEGRPEAEVHAYIERFALRTPREAAQTMKFIQHPLSRTYVFNYGMGEALLEPLLRGADAVENFRRLLSEPLSPGQVRRWVAGREQTASANAS